MQLLTKLNDTKSISICAAYSKVQQGPNKKEQQKLDRKNKQEHNEQLHIFWILP